MKGDSASRTKVFILSAIVIVALVGIMYLMVPEELNTAPEFEEPGVSSAQGIVRLEVMPPTNQETDSGGGE